MSNKNRLDQTSLKYFLYSKSNWADILQKHAYEQSTGTVKKWFGCGHFSLSYLSKNTQKSIP